MKETITHKITNFGILFTAFAAIPFNIITFYALQHSEYNFVRWMTPLLGLSILLLAVFSSRLELKFKVRIFSFLLFFAALFCLLLGLLDTASLWYVLLIIYTLFTGKRNHAFYLFVFAFISILIIGVLMINKNPYIPFNYGFEDCQVACVAVRIIDFLILGFLIYYIIKIFLNTIDAYIDEISQKATILERLNLSLQKELFEKNNNKILKEKLDFKNKELTINILKLLRQSELDNYLITSLKEISKMSETTTKGKIKKLIQSTKNNSNIIIWEEFEKQFIEVNTSFYDSLQQEFSTLSKNEKKICAFIKLNMNTKDMASLLNISVRGVETARYRLRKTMQLDSNIGLSHFLQNL